jgi:glycosyltransferase involved in cell wall biosynthesis
MKISYAITVCNEFAEIQRLLNQLLQHKKPQDEIVVLVDISKNEPSSYLLNYLREFNSKNTIKLDEGYFDGHFADWKNKLNSLCSGDFIFQIDADEYFPNEFIDLIHQILESNPEVDLYFVPRINTVSGLTEEHIQKWGWKVENGRVNYPDYQGRIYRNSSEIKWENKVHENIVGFKQYTALPEVDALSLIHPKTIERQERQNAYYETL